MTRLVTVTSKNQVTLPVEIVDSLGIKKGDKLFVTVEKKNDSMILHAEPLLDFQNLYGSVQSPYKKPLSLKKEHRLARIAAARHVASEGLDSA